MAAAGITKAATGGGSGITKPLAAGMGAGGKGDSWRRPPQLEQQSCRPLSPELRAVGGSGGNSSSAMTQHPWTPSLKLRAAGGRRSAAAVTAAIGRCICSYGWSGHHRGNRWKGLRHHAATCGGNGRCGEEPRAAGESNRNNSRYDNAIAAAAAAQLWQERTLPRQQLVGAKAPRSQLRREWELWGS